ncbi:hypothetical protein TrispH2_005106 [Trichoplax sp. H2]|uniref:Platelet-derived growth factor (PDGF) family profile domain-containing protein n=1 Tax=Trichoplax adhaerens TaxID=10228 RepID=B3RZ94_TRIAD|nr:predicted protein [Trichoplax adhaerens]EDV24164.1 predicted protein [Trichoplax adhaerens]RDD43250.1 hypothetical protein TrispH2_005106 [Trichoplax sp. H2]|eukprot:XP_002113690.1 predicted protein [Trichoplax adhaerens]
MNCSTFKVAIVALVALSGICYSYPRHTGNLISEEHGIEANNPSSFDEEKNILEEQEGSPRRLDLPDSEDSGTVKQSARYGKILQGACQVVEQDHLCPYNFDKDEQLSGGESVFYTAIPERCVVCDYKNCCPDTIKTCVAHEGYKSISYSLLRAGQKLPFKRTQKNRIGCGCMNGIPEERAAASPTNRTQSETSRRH